MTGTYLVYSLYRGGLLGWVDLSGESWRFGEDKILVPLLAVAYPGILFGGGEV